MAELGVYPSIYVCIYPSAGKHPSPLGKKKKKKKTTHTQTNSPHQNITVGFYRIKKYCSYQKLWRFLCDFLPAPIYRKSGDGQYLGAGKHPSPLEKKKKKKKKKKKIKKKKIVLVTT